MSDEEGFIKIILKSVYNLFIYINLDLAHNLPSRIEWQKTSIFHDPKANLSI